MHGSRPARVASRTHDGRTFSNAAACSASSKGSSSDKAKTGSTATTGSPSSDTPPPLTATQRRSHHTAPFNSASLVYEHAGPLRFPSGWCIDHSAVFAGKTCLLAGTTDRAKRCGINRAHRNERAYERLVAWWARSRADASESSFDGLASRREATANASNRIGLVRPSFAAPRFKPSSARNPHDLLTRAQPGCAADRRRAFSRHRRSGN